MAGKDRFRSGMGRRAGSPGRSKALAMIMLSLLFLLQTGCLQRSPGGTKTQEALAKLEEGSAAEAKELFLQALESGEDAVPAWRGLGIADLSLGQNEEAEQAFLKALAYMDDKMPATGKDVRQYLVTAQYRCGHYEDAIASCRELQKEHPGVEVFYYLGASSLALGDEAGAKEAFDEAVKLSPSDYLLYLQIYERYEKRNQTAVGDEYLQTALGIVPQSLEDSWHVGQIYYYLEMYDQARLAVEEGVRENYLPAMELMGEIYLAEENYQSALGMYQTMMEQNGESPLIYNGLALCAMQEGDYPKAVGYLQTGLELEEEDGKQELLFNEIVAYERMLDFETAKSKAEEYLRKYPADAYGQKEYQFLCTR